MGSPLKALRWTGGGTRRARRGEQVASLALWLPRGAQAGGLAEAVTKATVAALALPEPLAERAGRAAAACCARLLASSSAPRVHLLLRVDDTWCAVAATDYARPVSPATPAWLPVPGGARPAPARPPAWALDDDAPPDADDGTPVEAAADGGVDGGADPLELHRTPDGQLRVRCLIALQGRIHRTPVARAACHPVNWTDEGGAAAGQGLRATPP